MPQGPPPIGGDVNRASEIYAFTWCLEAISLAFVLSRMYTRIKLTRNVWWDDWCVCFAMTLDLIISVIWSVYAGRGYARHLYYIPPSELPDIIKLNTISRSLCMFSIAVGKISVAFLIERFAGPNRWRKWLLRGISISTFVSAVITLTFFYAQCQPAHAVWDKYLVKEGKAHCWNPRPVNTWNLIIASYWAFLDFALAAIPIDLVWKLKMSTKNKIMLSSLLGMGVFAGICAAVKTSKVPITVNAKSDITWATVELLMWNGIEMNVIIIAACIPTLRPLFLILTRHSTPSDFRPSRQNHSSLYFKHPSSDPSSGNSGNGGNHASRALARSSKALDIYRNHTATHTAAGSMGSARNSKQMRSENEIMVEESVTVESREADTEDEEWGRGEAEAWVALGEMGKAREGPPVERGGDAMERVEVDERFGVKGEDLV